MDTMHPVNGNIQPQFFDNEGQSCPICAQGIFESVPPLQEMISVVECTHCQYQMEKYSETT